jgi:hypothetical protein
MSLHPICRCVSFCSSGLRLSPSPLVGGHAKWYFERKTTRITKPVSSRWIEDQQEGNCARLSSVRPFDKGGRIIPDDLFAKVVLERAGKPLTVFRAELAQRNAVGGDAEHRYSLCGWGEHDERIGNGGGFHRAVSVVRPRVDKPADWQVSRSLCFRLTKSKWVRNDCRSGGDLASQSASALGVLATFLMPAGLNRVFHTGWNS